MAGGFNKFQKIIAALSLVGLLTPALLVPRAAQAIPVEVVGGRLDIIDTILHIPQLNVTNLNTGVSSKLTFLQRLEKFATEVLKRRILDAMVDQIIVWIQGGGEPMFVTNWNQFLEGAANVAVGDLVQDLGYGFLCKPFSAQLQIALNPTRRFQNSVTCTLDQIVGNIENFYNNFQNGGWIAYQASWEMNNTLWGTYALGLEEQDRRVYKSQKAAELAARTGNGFLPNQKCDPKTGICTIETPGSAVGSLVYKALGADFDYIVNAQDLSAYAAAITDALLNRLIVEGVSSLKGTATSGHGGYDTIDPCSGLTASSTPSLNDCRTSSFSSQQGTIIEIIDATLVPRRQALNYLQDSIDAETEYLAYLNQYFNQPNKKSCVESKIAAASVKRDALIAERASSSLAFSELEAKREEIYSDLAGNDWLGLEAKSRAILPLLDVVGAEQYRYAKEAEKNNIREDIERAMIIVGLCVINN